MRDIRETMSSESFYEKADLPFLNCPNYAVRCRILEKDNYDYESEHYPTTYSASTIGRENETWFPWTNELLELFQCGGKSIEENTIEIIDEEITTVDDVEEIKEEKPVVCQVTDKNGNKFTGQLINGKRNGFGKMMFAHSGNTYEGNWLYNRPHGFGRVVKGEGGGEYEGEWYNGKIVRVKEGIACIVSSKGDKYDGTFKNWKRHGYGVLTRENGEKYSGYFLDGQRSGYGSVTYPDGSAYEGIFFNDEPTGDICRPSLKAAASTAETYFNIDSWPSDDSDALDECDQTIRLEESLPQVDPKQRNLRKAMKNLSSPFNKKKDQSYDSESSDDDEDDLLVDIKLPSRKKARSPTTKVAPKKTKLQKMFSRRKDKNSPFRIIKKELTASTCYSSDTPTEIRIPTIGM